MAASINPVNPPNRHHPAAKRSRAVLFFSLKFRALMLCALMLCFAPGAAMSQDPELRQLLERFRIVREGGRRVVEVTLKDILALALKRSNILKISKIGKEIAYSKLIAAEARNNPTLTTKVERNRDINARANSSTFSTSRDDFLRVDTRYETVVSSEWSKKTSSGITYGLKLQDARTNSQTGIVSTQGGSSNPDQDVLSRSLSITSLTGSINIPLGQDLGSEVNDVPVRQGEVGLQRSSQEIRRDEFTILGTVAGIYWDLVDILERIKVEEESVRLSERLLGDNQARLQAGVISPADVKVSETQLARDRQTVLRFQLEALRVEDQLRAALNLEALAFGYRPIDRPELRKTRFVFKELAGKMFANNPELGILQTTLDENRYGLVEARNKDDTDLDLDLFYTANGFSGDRFGGASDFSESDFATFGASLTWTLPLFDHTTREEIRQKMLERSQIQVRVNDLRSNLSVQLQSTLRSLRLAEKEVETARISVSLAKELLGNEVERFQLGRSTSFRVAEFQQDSGEARQLEIAARVNYEKAFLNMLILTGDIYSFFGLPAGS